LRTLDIEHSLTPQGGVKTNGVRYSPQCDGPDLPERHRRSSSRLYDLLADQHLAGSGVLGDLGRRLTGTRVIVLVDGLRVRVLTEDGELIRELTLDPSRDYQAHGRS
jgi:hypothetical protein